MKVLLPIDILHPYQPLVAELKRLMPLSDSVLKLLFVMESAANFHSLLSGTGHSAETLDTALKSRGEKVLGDLATELSNDGINTSLQILQGSPAPTIEEVSNKEGFEVTIVAAHHLDSDARTPLGSTASHVVKHGLGTILLLRPTKKSGQDFKRVIVALDGSDTAIAALQTFVTQFKAKERGIEVVLVNIVQIIGLWKFVAPVEFIASVEDNLNMAGEAILADGEKVLSEFGVMPKELVIRTGDVADELIKVAAELKADAIVCGAKGKSAVEHLVLGSVSHKLSQHAELPLIIVR